MARTLCVMLPWFRSERITRSLEQPEPELAVVLRRGNTQLVTGVSRSAARVGVREDMTLAAARALLPQLQIIPQNDEAESDALESLAELLYQFTPGIRLARPNALLLDITGTETLHGGEAEIVAKTLVALGSLKYTANVAIADNSTAALTLAPYSEQQITTVGHGDAAFKNTSLPALRLPHRVERMLGDIGIRTVGEVLALPKNGLPQRFGDELVTRLLQLQGQREESFEPWRPTEKIRERLDFTAPTNNYTALLFLLKQAASFISTRLESRSLGARHLDVRMVCTDGDDLNFGFDTARPTMDTKGIETLLLSRFERLDRGDRWFEALHITAPSVEPVTQNQLTLFNRVEYSQSSGELNRLIDELVGRLGNESVSRAIATDHPHPSQSFRYVHYLSKEQSSESEYAGFRPAIVDRKQTIAVQNSFTELPALWDFSHYSGALKVVGHAERITVSEPTDFLTIETPDGATHWVAFTPGCWWLPRAMAEFRSDVAELNQCGITKEQTSAISGKQYSELVCASNFSFLRGASTADQLFETAAELKLHALAVTDWHSFAGIVRAHVASKEHGVKLIVGARIPLRDGPDVCLYAMTRKGYGHLCRLLTLGKRRTVKGDCELYLRDLAEFSKDTQCVVLGADESELGILEALKNIYAERISLGVGRHLQPEDAGRVKQVQALSESAGIPCVAVNDVHWHVEDQKFVQDIQTCIREGVVLGEAPGLLFPNGERRIKHSVEIASLFTTQPEWLSRSVEISNSCTFSLDELSYEYPDEVVPPGMSMQKYLEQETWAGARNRYENGVPEKVEAQLRTELNLIEDLGYAAYFLTVYDIVRFAQGKGILCQGRGSAANSSVCFCLGVTSVDPTRINLLFERFISKERNEPPDIDVDFEHERREEVIQYIYEKYSRERTGIAATTITYRSRSLARDVGKAVGLSDDQVDRLAKNIQWWDTQDQLVELLGEAGLSADDEQVQLALRGMKALRGFPRHLSQHVGGFVITQGRLDELVPIENAAMKDRTVIEWNKDDIDSLGILKVDCLSLGMLTACRKAFDLISSAGGKKHTFVSVFDCDPDGEGTTPEAKAIYGMLHKADAIGTFQVESRAQLSMLPRLKPSKFYDLVVEVAIVRPGPIQGGMVHPYLRRRSGEEAIEYPYEPLRPVLEKTCGVPLFQEQAMAIAVVAAGYTPGEADRLRRDMGSWRRTGVMDGHREKLIRGMRKNGISEDYANRIFEMISGFGEYGFPESHAASFGLITFVSCFLKRFYPAALTAGLINSQPMGFYSKSSLIRDAREHGIRIEPVCINVSDWDCALAGDGYEAASMETPPEAWGEPGPSIRLGIRVVKGVSEQTATAISEARSLSGKIKNVSDLVRRIQPSLSRQRLRHDLHALANADAFASLNISRRQAIWEIRNASADAPGMFKNLDMVEPKVNLPEQSEVEMVTADYHSTGLSLRAHPVSFLREELVEDGVQ
ncbi:MAG: error-prone DNA polymerase, partial [Planctomycetota bacterium]